MLSKQMESKQAEQKKIYKVVSIIKIYKYHLAAEDNTIN